MLFNLGKFLLGWYLGQEGVTSGFGTAGSLVVLLLWVYYSSLILLFGAEFTRVYAATIWLRCATQRQRRAAFRRGPGQGGHAKTGAITRSRTRPQVNAEVKPT